MASCLQNMFRRQLLPVVYTQHIRCKSKRPARFGRPPMFKGTGVNREWLVWITQPLDLNMKSLEKWLTNNKWKNVREDQKYNPLRKETLGKDLAAAHFVVARGGAIQFKGFDRWIERDKDGDYHLPGTEIADLFVEAIDCSNVEIMYNSFDNFRHLDHLKSLKLSGCKHVDDYCMDRLGALFSDTLVHLDLSGCPGISERGLTALHRLRNLRMLELRDMAMVPDPSIISIMIEDVLPNCRVIDVDYTNLTFDKDLNEMGEIEKPKDIPSFVANLGDSLSRRKKESRRVMFMDNILPPVEEEEDKEKKAKT